MRCCIPVDTGYGVGMDPVYDKAVLDAGLRALELELRERAPGKTFDFVVIGGASLLLRQLGSRATSDVDVLGVWTGDSVVSASPLPQIVRDAAILVARQVGLAENWFGDDRTLGVLHAPPPLGYQSRLERYVVGPSLTLRLPDRTDLVALKLDAAANTGGSERSKHHDDLATLAPSDEELDAALDWIRTLYVDDDPAIGDALAIAAWIRGRR